jgi:uncharacterized membrane protein/uncharacterized membrane protein YeaQ/YmgE (transglycosylase-associated protein family)
MILQSVFVWVLTGLFAGWVARLAMRSQRDYGVVGDLVTGCLGAVLGGWLLPQLDVWAPPNVLGHGLVALIGAATLLIAFRIVRSLGAAVGLTAPAAIAAKAGNLDGLLRQATDLERSLIAKFLRRGHISSDVNQAFEAQLTIGQRFADQVAAFGGSWPFIGIFLAAMVVWMAVNEDMSKPFDPYPYILLNLILSCLAAIQAPIIMMSQNRQAARDRLDARNDFEVNLRAEMEIMALHEKLDRLRAKEIMDLVRSVEEQMQRLGELEKKLTARTNGSASASG